MAFCFPSPDEINNLRVPLTPGERHLLDFLLDYLDDNFEIYVQPFLNGDRPDIIIVRPDAGVLIIEVKDWVLIHYNNPSGRTAAWKLQKDDSTIRSPLAQVESYKKNLYDLHIHKLFELNIKNKNSFGLVKTAVYFHEETERDAKDFCKDSGYVYIMGSDSLIPQTFNFLLKKMNLDRKSGFFDEELYTSFRRFLKPPEHTADMGKDIIYRPEQLKLTISQANTRQKVKGVAGCGKTKILAGRAVSAYGRTKELVLILTFNITLRNYIHDRISEVRADFPWSAFEITNYHQFFRNQANNQGIECTDMIANFDNSDFFKPVKNEITKYKTILIDEIQDYKSEWLITLTRYFLDGDGELVVFGDEKQNVYSRQMGSDLFPVIPTIPGRWRELKESFRMGSNTLRIAQLFQTSYFQGYYELDTNIKTIQRDMLQEKELFRYHFQPSISRESLFDLINTEIRLLEIHPNDLVILAPTHETIRRLEQSFRCINNERTTHAGETQEEYENLLAKYQIQNTESPSKNTKFKQDLDSIRRGRKLHFWPHAGTVKLSTIHSFKGWEAHTLVLIIQDTYGIEEQGSLNELIYTALTRVQKNLIVIDTTGLYQEFFSSISDWY